MAELLNHPLVNTVSERCKSVFFDELYMKTMQSDVKDAYDEETNPQGYIGLGTSVNYLCEDLLEERLSSIAPINRKHLHYPPNEGTLELREAAAQFLTRKFNATIPVDPLKLVVTNGVTGAFDFLAHILADPGDVFLSVGPSYSRIFWDPYERAQVGSHVIPLSSKEENGRKSWQLTPQQVEDALLECQKIGKKLKALMLINPHNPLGSVLTKDALQSILEICKRYSIHVVVDEVYALSVWDDSSTFVSVLSLESLPDPDRTHVLWGCSKDFGFPGSRIGFLYSRNTCVVRALGRFTYFSMAPIYVQDVTAQLLQDSEWQEKYLQIARHRIKEAFEFTRDRLENMGVRVHPASSGFYIWADFNKFFHGTTMEDDSKFFQTFMRTTKVSVVPGSQMFCPEPGWCRIVYTVPRDRMEIALSRMEKYLSTL